MAIWQHISDTLIGEIESGVLDAGGRLPGDAELAVRFGVHRHTVRRALADLQGRGLVRSERGRGTFVVEDAIAYRWGTHTRFEENLLENMRIPSRRLLSIAKFGAPGELAQLLQIKPGRPIVMATLLGEADSIPVHLFRPYFSVDRFPGIKEVLEEAPVDQASNVSLASILARVGVNEFKRRNARLRCRLPSAEEARHLKMSPRDPVFETEILNVDGTGIPVFFGRTCICGGRIEFVFDH